MQFSNVDGEHWYNTPCTSGQCTVYYSNTMGILPYICGSKYVISTCIRRPSMVDMWVKGLMGIYGESTNFHHRLYIQIYLPHKTHKRAILEKENQNCGTQILFFNKIFGIDKVYTKIFGEARSSAYIHGVRNN